MPSKTKRTSHHPGGHGGSAPYTWAVAAGSLPIGLQLSASGEITGTPSVSGSFSFDVAVTDADGVTRQAKSLSIQVLSATTTATPVSTLGTWALALLGVLTADLGLQHRSGNVRKALG